MNTPVVTEYWINLYTNKIDLDNGEIFHFIHRSQEDAFDGARVACSDEIGEDITIMKVILHDGVKVKAEIVTY